MPVVDVKNLEGKTVDGKVLSDRVKERLSKMG